MKLLLATVIASLLFSISSASAACTDNTIILVVGNATSCPGTTPYTNVGVIDGSNAAAGTIGEVISSVIASGSAVSLTTAAPANVTSISLTAGDWDVAGVVNFLGTTISTTAVAGSVNSTTATLASLPSTGRTDVSLFGTALANSAAATQTGPTRFSLASTTTVYLVGQCTFTGGTCTAYGMIRARRVR